MRDVGRKEPVKLWRIFIVSAKHFLEKEHVWASIILCA